MAFSLKMNLALVWFSLSLNSSSETSPQGDFSSAILSIIVDPFVSPAVLCQESEWDSDFPWITGDREQRIAKTLLRNQGEKSLEIWGEAWRLVDESVESENRSLILEWAVPTIYIYDYEWFIQPGFLQDR